MSTRHEPSTKSSHLDRVLGLRDLTFFLIAALVNLNSVPVVAGVGPAALLLWTCGFFLFFIPQAIAVLEFSHRSPEEGGIYNWNKASFGHAHGFVAGWCYWTNNIFYLPTLLLYIIGFGSFIGGSRTTWLVQDPISLTLASLALLWFLTWLNIRGFAVGRWVQNLGASGTLLTALIMAVIGSIAWMQRGPSNSFAPGAIIAAAADWKVFSLLSIVCLNYVGLELGAVIGGEIKNPLRNIPRAIAIACAATGMLFLLVTTSLLLAIPSSEIGVIDGLLQGVERVASEIGLTWIVIPMAILMSLNAAGNASAWLSGAARIPFVIGIDKYLPASLGRIHSRHHTPHIALIVQGLASSLVLLMGAIGSTVHDMYLVLLQTTVVLQLIPYVYMFAALFRIDRTYAGIPGLVRSRLVRRIAAGMGLIMTVLGIVTAFVPSAGVEGIVTYELKLASGTVGFILAGLSFYAIRNRRDTKSDEVEMEPT